MSRPFMALAVKDFRALLPVWAASAITVLAEPLLRGTLLASFPLGMFAYIVGAIALGAHAIGHEYAHRTLATLLVQPWKRSSMLATKALVLVLMLVALALVAWPILARGDAREFATFGRWWQLGLPLAGGLFVAPYLTMKLRSQIAGVVFTASIPGMVWLLALLAGVSIYGTGDAAAEKLALRVWPPAMFLCGAGGAVLSAQSFMRLQAIEERGSALSLPRWLVAADRNPIRPPLWMLVKKELRLQQMTFALVAFCGVVCLALAIAQIKLEFLRDFPVRGVGMLYLALLPLVIGSLASAEERQLGTLESQAMLPVSSAHQWTIKAAVVLLLALVLGVFLPWFVFAPPQLARQSFWVLTGTILLLTTWCLYISSWCRSGVVALALILPASAAAMALVRWIDWMLAPLFTSHRGLGDYLALTQPSAHFVVWMAIGTPLAVLMLFFASRNHWTSERTVRRLALQVAWLVALFVVTDVVTSVL